MAKLTVSIRDESYRLLSFEVRERGITIQELIREVIVPEWVRGSDLSTVRRDDNPLQPSSIVLEENEIRPVTNRPIR
jgi:hypothetical protein